MLLSEEARPKAEGETEADTSANLHPHPISHRTPVVFSFLHLDTTPSVKQRKPEALTEAAADAIRANPKAVMTLPEAAAYLCHSPRKLRDLVKLRRIPFVDLSGQGGKLLFRLSDINGYLDGQARKAA